MVERTGRSPPIAKLVALGVVLIVLTALGPWLHHRFGGIAHWLVVGITAGGAAWAAFASDRLDNRRALATIGIVAVALRLTLLFVEPYLSDDIYRYVWDGRVQAAGVNPYRYVPAAPELSSLRDAAIYPRINRADYAPTIYPPVAQMFFLAVTRLGESVLAMKIGLLACEGIALVATLAILTRFELPPARIAAFAWHPLPIWEIAGNGHVDALMVCLMMLSVVAMIAGRTLLAGAIATAAALVKPLGLLLLPVLWRPWNWRLPALVVGMVVLFYAPYLSVGTEVFGFLSGYVREEELSHGTGFRYLMIAERLLGTLPGAATYYVAASAAVMLALALAVGFRKDRSERASVLALVVLLTAFLVLLTPHYPWYYLALVPFLAVYPASWTLWLLTVGGLQTYQVIPGEIMPDYIDRQIVFHSLVLAAIARDLWTARPTAKAEAPRATTGDLPA